MFSVSLSEFDESSSGAFDTEPPHTKALCGPLFSHNCVSSADLVDICPVLCSKYLNMNSVSR